MTISIDKPVGLRWRTQNVTNRQTDQQKIIQLLWNIPSSQGGKKDSPAAPPLAGPDGSVPKWVADAIWDFQTHWKGRGVFRNIDGVVDPGMNTLRQMNALANGQTPITPNGTPSNPQTPNGNEIPLPTTPASLRSLGFLLTHWKVTSGGESLSISAKAGGAATARIVLAKAGDPLPHYFTFAGASAGVGPLPFGVNIAPASLWSTGSRVAGRSAFLEADDFRGPCSIIAGSSNFFAGIPDGATASLIIFGMRLSSNLRTIPSQIRSARAVAATLGHFKGVDIGLSIAMGYLS